MDIDSKTEFLEKVRLWFQYLEICEDQQANIWLLSNQPSNFISSTIDFEIGSGLSIIDSFDGRQPWLLDKEFCKKPKETYYIKTFPTVLLDSQILTLLGRYFNKDSRMDLLDKRCIHELLKFFAKTKCDINPFFYYMESLVKNKDLNEAKKRGYAINAAEIVLKTHLMDEETFLNENCMTLDWERFESYKQEYNISSDCIKDLAPLWYDKNYVEIIEDPTFIQHSKYIVNHTYASLLKMMLIHKSSGKGVVKNCKTFLLF